MLSHSTEQCKHICCPSLVAYGETNKRTIDMPWTRGPITILTDQAIYSIDIVERGVVTSAQSYAHP